MIQIPLPDSGDVPVNNGTAVALNPGQKATITVKPETSGNLHRIPLVACDWFDNASYSVEVDGTNRYGPSPIPPTDVDAPSVTFVPGLRLNRKLVITIKDLRSTGDTRTYRTRVIGWEA